MAALDSRVKVCIDLAAQVDIETLLLHRRLDHHGFYYYVPNLLTAYTTLAIQEKIAPRPRLSLVGKNDTMCLDEGVLKLRKGLDKKYQSMGSPENFSSFSLTGGHMETQEMRNIWKQFIREHLLQCTGYGSLVQTPSGRWYMTYLCTRPLNGAAILGRETAIQEVYWTSDDWLRLKDSQTTPMEEIMIETNEEVQQEKDHQFMDTFEGELKKNWNAGRILPNADWCDTKCRPSMCRSGRRIYAGTHWLPIVYNRWSHPISFSTRKDLYDGKLVTSILLIRIRNHFASRLPTESFKNCIYW